MPAEEEFINSTPSLSVETVRIIIEQADERSVESLVMVSTVFALHIKAIYKDYK